MFDCYSQGIGHLQMLETLNLYLYIKQCFDINTAFIGVVKVAVL